VKEETRERIKKIIERAITGSFDALHRPASAAVSEVECLYDADLNGATVTLRDENSRLAEEVDGKGAETDVADLLLEMYKKSSEDHLCELKTIKELLADRRRKCDEHASLMGGGNRGLAEEDRVLTFDLKQEVDRLQAALTISNYAKDHFRNTYQHMMVERNSDGYAHLVITIDGKPFNSLTLRAGTSHEYELLGEGDTQ